MTLEKLINAIRQADDLNELKRLVGPSKEEAQAHKENLDRFVELGDKHGYNYPSLSHLGQEISKFEETYY